MNLIDTPGHVDFTIEVERALRVLDGAILLVCGVSGVQSQTLTVNRQMSRYKVPRLIFINKLDRTGSNFPIVLKDIKSRLPMRSAAIQVPIGSESTFAGEIDLITMKAHYYEGAWGIDRTEREIPEELLSTAQCAREELLESLAEIDDEFAEKYLAGEVSVEDIDCAVRAGVLALKFAPILIGSAYRNKGVQGALDAVGKYLPCPLEPVNVALDLSQDEKEVALSADPQLPLVLLAFKLEESRFGQLTYIRIYQGKLKRGDTITNTASKKRVKISRMVRMHAKEMVEIQESGAGDICALFGIECNSGDTFTDGTVQYSMTSMFVPDPVMSLSIRPTRKEYAGKFSKALARFQREDPTFRVRFDEESGETVISGMGELHLSIYAERIRREFSINVELGQPSVNYREVIAKKAHFAYLHKKQTGGAGQYAGVVGYIEPIPGLAPGEFVPSKFIDKTAGMNIGPEFKAAIHKGVLECVAKGLQVGYPVLNLQYVLTDGQTHLVDSSTNAFIIATKGSFREVFPKADPGLVEPIMNIELTVPSVFQTTVISGLVKRQCMIKDANSRDDGTSILLAEGSLAKMFGYASELRSNTQGQGEFSMEFLKLDAVNEGEAQMLRDRYSEKLQIQRESGLLEEDF